MVINYLSNLKRFEPRLYFMINRFIPTTNHTVSHFTGDANMVAFATHVQQLSLGALYCKFNEYNFFSIEHPYFQDFKIIKDKNSSKFSFLKKKYRFFYFNRPETNFYKRNDYFNNEENDFPILESEKTRYIKEIHDFNKNYLYKKLTIKKDINIDNNTLVIHIRTGDIFNGDWHSLYTQNPLSYFLKISNEFEKVIVVCGKIHNNPVLEYLKKDKRFYIQSGTFEEDFNILLNAKNLATSGVSGFPISAALMSQKLENFYHSNLYLEEHLNPKMVNKQYVDVHSYKIDDYIPVGKFYNNEENLMRILSKDQSKVIKN